MSYCSFARSQPEDDMHYIYHSDNYGKFIKDDNQLFARLLLEINQAGLSWNIILKKSQDLLQAYDGADIQKVANYDQTKIDQLLQDSRIIRNKLKVNAAIYNAQQILELQNQHGSFQAWLKVNHPQELQDWVKIFKRTFKFTGGEIANEFLMSINLLPGAHDPDCPLYRPIGT